MLKLALGPSQAVRGLLQLSTALPAEEVVGCWGINVGIPVGVFTIEGSAVKVGDAMDVTVGTGVKVSVGMGVLVGRAA
jgi:hypothetical protein